MTLLHDFFHAKNVQGFQRLLDASTDSKKQTTGGSAAAGTSGGNRPSPLTSNAVCMDVNARDWLGRSTLHLVVSSEDCLDYLRLLLKHPSININLADVESQWTPLHRALYHANIPAARLLLQRPEVDISLKDKEGYTAFDVYNSTLHGTKPDVEDQDAELFTWGANRNAALGLGDGNDRVHADKVVLKFKEDLPTTLPISQRFGSINVRDVQMSKLHTAVVTSESSGNLRVCGFGSGGRLGRGQQMQYDLNGLPQFDYTITAIALGQDHTLAVTKSGEVLSWGLNRFSQLGYVVETTSGKFDEPIQAVPKKILHPLRKEVVIGVAASKVASGCWTEEDVYTWGTNNGQLGYDKQAHPVQILPRKVTKFSGPIIAMSMTDTVMACLLRTQQVECIWNDRHYRINFPLNAFPQEIQPYRPPQAIKASQIAKITASDDLIAALSSNGEVFTFSSPTSSDQSQDSRYPFQPQRVWALRKKFSSVRDVAIGSEGSIAVCTESGHVYLRIRNSKAGGGKNFKFQRVAYLQRITHVSANSTGAFGALRIDFRPEPIPLVGNSLAQDLSTMEPFVRVEEGRKEDVVVPLAPEIDDADEEEYREDVDLRHDIAKLRALIKSWKLEKEPSAHAQRLPHGADTKIYVGKLCFPAHRSILAARSKPLLGLLGGKSLAEGNLTIKLLPPRPGPGLGVSKITVLKADGVSPLSLLILLHYLYADEVLAIWDRRINIALAADRRGLSIDAGLIKTDLQVLARALDLPALQAVLHAPVRRVPAPTAPRDFAALSALVQTDLPRASEPLHADVLLEFGDKGVWAHSVILRCRSALFAGMFGSEEWTQRRWTPEGVLKVDFRHLKWDVMQYVVRFVMCGEDREMFEVLSFCQTADDVLEFMFQVMGAATEFLLDRLILICSSIILGYLNIQNCCYILAEATHYNAVELVDRVHEYIAANMESLLESRILDDVPQQLLVQLSKFITKKQTEKNKFTRTFDYLDMLFAKHWDWLASEDIPSPIVRSLKSITKESREAGRPRISPKFSKEKEAPTARGADPSIATPLTPLTPLPLRQRPSGEDIFTMDTVDVKTSGKQGPDPTAMRAEAPGPVWKVSEAPRTDMKALMAEASMSTSLGSPKYVVKKTSTEPPPPLESTPPNHSVSPSTPTKTPVRNPNSPWRSSSKVEVPNPSFPPLGAPSPSAQRQPTSGPPRGGLSMTRPPPALIHALPSPSQHAPGSGGKNINVPPGRVLGPVITPGKQPSSASNSIRVASGKAWTAPPPEPARPIASGTLSFAAIQAAQEEQLLAGPSKDTRSLREIQQEEAELQQEADFLKWWHEEEERVKQETAALNAFQRQAQGRGPSGGGGQRGQGKRQRASGPGRAARPNRGGDVGPSKPRGKGRGASDQGSNITFPDLAGTTGDANVEAMPTQGSGPPRSGHSVKASNGDRVDQLPVEPRAQGAPKRKNTPGHTRKPNIKNRQPNSRRDAQ